MSLLVALVLDFAGVGLFGAVHTVHRVETGSEHFLLALAVATTHGLDDVIKPGFLFFLLHDT